MLSIGLIGPNKGPDQLFSATQLYETGSSDVPNNPTNASSWADAGGINRSGGKPSTKGQPAHSPSVELSTFHSASSVVGPGHGRICSVARVKPVLRICVARRRRHLQLQHLDMGTRYLRVASTDHSILWQRWRREQRDCTRRKRAVLHQSSLHK